MLLLRRRPSGAWLQQAAAAAERVWPADSLGWTQQHRHKRDGQEGVSATQQPCQEASPAAVQLASSEAGRSSFSPGSSGGSLAGLPWAGSAAPGSSSMQRRGYGVSPAALHQQQRRRQQQQEEEDEEEEAEAQPAFKRRPGRRPREVPEYDAGQLAYSLGLPWLDRDALRAAISRLPRSRQVGVLDNGQEVAAHLRSLDVNDEQLGRLALRSPVLFSWPAERIGQLFGQLRRLGLPAPEAARCFDVQPRAGGVASFAPTIGVLAHLLATAGDGVGEGPGGCAQGAGFQSRSGEGRLGEVLRGQPGAITLLFPVHASSMAAKIDNLRQLGLSDQQIVGGLRQSWDLLQRSPAHIRGMAAVLEQELGGGRELFARLLALKPRVTTANLDTLRRSAAALARTFGRDGAADLAWRSPQLLAVNAPIWQTALAVARLCGAADPPALMRRNPRLFSYDWLQPARLLNRLAVEQCVGVSAAEAYEGFCTYITHCSPLRLTARLLYLRRLGAEDAIVARRVPALHEWREGRGLPPRRRAEGEPAVLTPSELSALSSEEFGRHPLVLQRGGSLPGLESFQAQLEGNPDWRRLRGEAQAERMRLLGTLPPELRQAAEERGQADAGRPWRGRPMPAY